MDILLTRILRGPNIWNQCKLIEVHIACEPFEIKNPKHLNFQMFLCGVVPEIQTLFSHEKNPDLSFAHIIEFLTFRFQELVGCPIEFSQTKLRQQSNVFHVAIEYTEEPVGRFALQMADDLCQAALNNKPFDLASSLHQLQELYEDVRMGPSTQAVVSSANKRTIPFRRLTEGSLVQLGWGSKQRRIQASVLDNTNVIASHIAQNKELSKQILAAHGLPVPKGRRVSSVEDALDAANEIGFPVVVKPTNGRQGKGVIANVTSPEQLVNAYHIAAEYQDDVLVERYIPGDDFRLLVVGEKLVAAARRQPPIIIGDGKHSVRELIELLNQDPRRGRGHGMAMTFVEMDDISRTKLEAEGLNLESIPHKNQSIVLRQNANLSSGGTATDVTNEVHPTIAQCAIEAMRVAGGLNSCGVDLICERIDQPLDQQEAGIVEINAGPGLRMHLLPSYGTPRDIGQAIIDDLFAPGEDGRIPIISVTGTNGKTTTVRLIASILTEHGFRVGMTSTDGIFIDGQQIDVGDCSGPKSANNILLNPDVDAAVFETARGGILREGLGFDHCQIAVVTNIGKGDHLGISDIHSAEELAHVKQTIIKTLTPSGVAILNADDTLVAAMAENCLASIVYFSFNPKHPLLINHLKQGFRAVYVENKCIVAAEGTSQYRIPLKEIPITLDGMIQFQIENVMASVAAAWSIGVAWQTIESCLKTFMSDIKTTPGRFNLLKHRGAQLIIDYGHNEDAINSLVKAIKLMPSARRLLVLTGTGDRRDQDIRRLAQILGDVFDNIFIYQMKNLRGRAEGEITGLLREGFYDTKRALSIKDINDEVSAIDAALSQVSEGDLCLILIDEVEDSLEYISSQVTRC